MSNGCQERVWDNGELTKCGKLADLTGYCREHYSPARAVEADLEALAREYLGRVYRLVVEARAAGRDTVRLDEIEACMRPTA